MLDGYVSRRLGSARILTRAEQDDKRLSLLKEAVSHAVNNSRFYGERLKGADFDSFESFSALPFTTPEDVISRGHDMLCVPARDIHRVVTLFTSGTTGTPKRIYFTEEELRLTEEYFSHGMAEFVTAGQKVLILFPGRSPDCLNELLTRALSRIGVKSQVFGFPAPGSCGELLKTVIDGYFDFLAGPPEAVSGFARYLLDENLSHRLSGRIKGVLLAASCVTEKCVEEIKAAFGCTVFEHYSMTETAYAGCVGCTVTPTCHIWESDLYYELVDQESGLPVLPGETGEIVVTTLRKRAMPFIRYRTGDLSRLITRPCPCGSILRRLSRVESRPDPKKFRRPEIRP